MLNRIMDNHALFYAIAVVGAVGVIGLLLVNAFYDRTIRDLRRMDAPKSRWLREFIKDYQLKTIKRQKIQNAEAFIRTQMMKGKSFGVFVYQLKRWSGYCGITILTLMGVGLYGTYAIGLGWTDRSHYMLAGVVGSLILLLMRPFLCFSQKEDMILDALSDYVENQTVEEPTVTQAAPAENTGRGEADKESLANQVAEGIRQTAASAVEPSKYSHLLTPEEENIMREVIKEYLT